MSAEPVNLQLGAPISRLVLDRPERRNALSLEMMQAVQHALQTVATDAETRVLVIEGNGPAFSSGHDLAEIVGHPDREFHELLFSTCVAMMQQLHALPQPVIAKVHGVATAAGCQLVAACDLAIAADDARFATPGVNIGLFCSTPMVPVSRSVGPKRALELLLTGEMIDAHTAVSWGLVNRAVPSDQLEAEVVALATRLAHASPYVLALGKRAFYAQAGADETTAYDLTARVMVENAQAPDADEGMRAFLEKREPQWPKS